MKKHESAEISIGSASGKAGVGSVPFGRGYFQSGSNNGAAGIHFTPSEEPRLKSYKSMKHSKKKLKKMKKFDEFINEEACATMGNGGGMGAVVSAQPSATPGSVNASDATIGSGDIGQGLGTAYMKTQLKLKKDKKRKLKKFDDFSNFKP